MSGVVKIMKLSPGIHHSPVAFSIISGLEASGYFHHGGWYTGGPVLNTKSLCWIFSFFFLPSFFFLLLDFCPCSFHALF